MENTINNRVFVQEGEWKYLRIEALKYRTEDKRDIIIVVDFFVDYNNTEWRIAEIKYKTSRQREYRWFTDSFKDEYSYRKLDMKGRQEYAVKKFEGFVGREKLEEAVETAWRNIRPDLDNIGTTNI